MIFYWVDTTLTRARLADPLLRDPFRWNNLRMILWFSNIISIFITAAIIISPGGLLSDFGFLFYLPFAITLLSGATLIPLQARRSKDSTLNKHLRWFSLFLAFLFLFVLLVPNLTGDLTLFTLSSVLGLMAGAYCLIRSARALVPLNKFSKEDSEVVLRNS